MPVPPQFVGVLERLLGVDVEADVGPCVVAGWVGEDDAGGEVPDGALAVGLHRFQVALDVSPVPVGLLLLVVFVRLLVHIKLL